MNRLLSAVVLSLCSASIAFCDLPLPELIKKINPSVCKLETESGTGSGFVVANDIIVTNCHVIAGVDAVKVKFHDGTQLPSEGTLYLDVKRDIAILRVKSIPADLPHVTLRNEHPDQGETVIAIGNPMGVSRAVTKGIVSAIRAAKELDEQFHMKDAHAGTWVQTDAAISPGNSGGPLVDLKGEVVGMCTVSAGGAQNLNYAISAVDIQSLLKLAKDKAVAKFDPEQKIIRVPKIEHDHLAVLSQFDGRWRIRRENRLNNMTVVITGTAVGKMDLDNDTVVVNFNYNKVQVSDQVGRFSQSRGGKPRFKVDEGSQYPERIKRYRSWAKDFFSEKNKSSLTIKFVPNTGVYEAKTQFSDGQKVFTDYFYHPKKERLTPLDPRGQLYYELGMEKKWAHISITPGYALTANKIKNH